MVLERVCPRIDGRFPLETPRKESAWPAGVGSCAKSPWTFPISATSQPLVFIHTDLRPQSHVLSSPVLCLFVRELNASTSKNSEL